MIKRSALKVKRIDEINESFKATVSGDLDVITNETIDGNDGVEIREKLLKILDLVLDAPDKLIHLKIQIIFIYKFSWCI